MTSPWEWISLAIAVVLSIPFVVITVELLAALVPARKKTSRNFERPRVAVLVPAHNEELHLQHTLTQIKAQLAANDRILVVADNCDDRTALIGKESGAEVLERHDEIRRGKGFALDAGFKFLSTDPPGVVIVVDADTSVLPGAIDALARSVAASNRPQQGEYLLVAPPTAGPASRLAAFAFFVKNAIRPRGMTRLRLPCLLYGAGMAFPWELLSRVDLAHGDITEDIRLGAELARMGHPVMYCSDAHVRGGWPNQVDAVRTQRRRWEHGHLRTLMREVPRLLVSGICQVRVDLLALALHLGVPPLTFLFLLGLAATICFFICGQVIAETVLLSTMSAAVAMVVLIWFRFARDRVFVSDLFLVPVYLIRKIPLYLRFIFRPQREWVRTARDQRPEQPVAEKSERK